MDPHELARALERGDRRAIARLISLVEDHADELGEVMRLIGTKTSHAYTVGLTGSPGVGKSTLAGALVGVLRAREKRVSVLAIDPTSPLTGGALLGDRLRMQTHSTDPGVFIRSMATRGRLGGLAWAAPHALRILDAGGTDVILLETVGVGQAEVDVSVQAETTVVVLAPGLGDSVQANKAGLLEIADVFVINKSDREGARSVVRDLQQMQSLGEHAAWVPPILLAQADSGDGIAEVWEAVERHRAHLESSGELHTRRLARAASEIREIALERVRRSIGDFKDPTTLRALAEEVVEHRLEPYAAADKLLTEVET